MKKTSIIVFTWAILIVACTGDHELTTDLVNNPNTASGEIDTVNLPKIEFANELHDFGKITQGEKVKYDFRFTNTGKKDLIISSARGSCGCTVPDWPKKPIPPGGEGVINVVFNSEGRSGTIHKKITVVANTQPSTAIVAIKGEIIAPSKDEPSEDE